MSNGDLVRVWKDEEYRLSLSEADRMLLPENPAGSFELTEAELDQVVGAYKKKCEKHKEKDCKVCFVCVFLSILNVSCDNRSLCNNRSIVINL